MTYTTLDCRDGQHTACAACDCECHVAPESPAMTGCETCDEHGPELPTTAAGARDLHRALHDLCHAALEALAMTILARLLLRKADVTRCPATCPTCNHQCSAMSVPHARHYDKHDHNWENAS